MCKTMKRGSAGITQYLNTSSLRQEGDVRIDTIKGYQYKYSLGRVTYQGGREIILFMEKLLNIWIMIDEKLQS